MRRLIAVMLGAMEADKEPKLLAHVPVRSDDPVVTAPVDPEGNAAPNGPRRPLHEKLLDARQRHGRAFKCAAPNVDREVIIVPGEVRIVKAHHKPTQGMAAPKQRAEVRRIAGGGR